MAPACPPDASALLSSADFSRSDSSIMVTIFSKRLEPLISFTRRVDFPFFHHRAGVDVAVPRICGTGSASPVRGRLIDHGLALCHRTVTKESHFPYVPGPGLLPEPRAPGTSTSCPSRTSHTLLMFKDILLARSSTDFLWVHSSRISPTPSRNMMEEAVLILPRTMEMAMAVPSSTGTSIFPFARGLKAVFDIFYGSHRRENRPQWIGNKQPASVIENDPVDQFIPVLLIQSAAAASAAFVRHFHTGRAEVSEHPEDVCPALRVYRMTTSAGAFLHFHRLHGFFQAQIILKRVRLFAGQLFLTALQADPSPDFMFDFKLHYEFLFSKWKCKQCSFP